VNVSKVATALALSVALAATLVAAPQGTTPAAPAKKSDSQKADKGDKADKGGKAAKAETVKPADLPKAVTDAVMKAHPKGTIDSATKSMMGADTVYAVKVMENGKALPTMRVKADGTAVVAAKKGKGKDK
jgi:hypothetical protein